jgi:hypothetical protein
MVESVQVTAAPERTAEQTANGRVIQHCAPGVESVFHDIAGRVDRALRRLTERVHPFAEHTVLAFAHRLRAGADIAGRFAHDARVDDLAVLSSVNSMTAPGGVTHQLHGLPCGVRRLVDDRKIEQTANAGLLGRVLVEPGGAERVFVVKAGRIERALYRLVRSRSKEGDFDNDRGIARACPTRHRYREIAPRIGLCRR